MKRGVSFYRTLDGEKLDGMVATLVIGLPSIYEGGELIVSHDGTQHKLALTGAATGYELSYAAFYADCQHEVQPVRSGYRLCLTYNVTLAKSSGKNKQGLMAPDFGSAATAVGELLSDWSLEVSSISSDMPHKLAVTLEHRYTQAGLALDALKGVDRSRAEVLFEAAEQADCVAHLALVTHWQNGSAEGGYDEYSSRGSPHTLVCTKTTASYERALDIHKRDLNNLARIVKLGKKIGSW